MYCDHRREFSVEETNLVEIVAGRFAADLEREMLLQQTLQTRTLSRQLSHAVHWHRSRLPRIKPLIDGWIVGGWTSFGDCLGGDFYDWAVLPDGSLAVAVGDAQGKMFEASLTAGALHTALKSHAHYRHTAGQMAERINETLWTASAGDQFGSLFYAMIHPDSGRLEHVAAGHVHASIVDNKREDLAVGDTEPLGTQPDSQYVSGRARLGEGQILVALSEGVLRGLRSSQKQAFWRVFKKHRDRHVDEIVEQARTFLEQLTGLGETEDRTILVVKRT
jgi:serine phosphatase RsbU (regulator of sigma subunit)